MSQVLLNLPDINAVQKKMRGERVTKYMNGNWLVDVCLMRCGLHGLLNHGVAEMMAAHDARTRIC